MGVVMFYHLTRSGADETLMTLIGRATARGWRVMVRGTDAGTLERLDARLWAEPPDGFVPHALAGGAQDARQPVLLGQGAVGNDAHVLAVVDGARPMAHEIAGLERVWVVFEGGDAAAVEAARGLWREVTEAAHAAQYWTEDSGNWQMKMEKTAPHS